MSSADACLARLSERHRECQVLTLDKDFRIYRRHGNKVIPVLMPEEMTLNTSARRDRSRPTTR